MIKNSPKKEPIKCPCCQYSFIPHSFNLFDTWFYHKSPHGKINQKEMEDFTLIENPTNLFRNIPEKNYKPLRIPLKNWVTICPNCGFNLYFAAQIAIRDIVKYEFKEYENHPSSWFIQERNKQYYYRLQDYPHPYYDYNDYFEEKFKESKNKIDNALEQIPLNDFCELFKQWEGNHMDTFKYFIKFHTKLEKYCNSQVEGFMDKNMPKKIEECHFSSVLEVRLKGLNEIRNKMVHGDYQPDEEDKILLKEVFYHLLRELIINYLKPLNINEIELKDEEEFLDLDYIKHEVWRYLKQQIGRIPTSRGYSKNDLIIKPVLESLEYYL